MSITPAEPYGNTETREPVWRETVDSATYGESRARVAHAVETFKRYDNTGILPETERLCQNWFNRANGKPVKGPR